MSETLSRDDAELLAMLRVIANQVCKDSRLKHISLESAVEREVVRIGGRQLRTPIDPFMFMLTERDGMGLAYRIFHGEYAFAIEFLLFVMSSTSKGTFIARTTTVLHQLEIELPRWRAACEHARELAAQRKF